MAAYLWTLIRFPWHEEHIGNQSFNQESKWVAFALFGSLLVPS